MVDQGTVPTLAVCSPCGVVWSAADVPTTIRIFHRCYSCKEGNRFKLNKGELKLVLPRELTEFLSGSPPRTRGCTASTVGRSLATPPTPSWSSEAAQCAGAQRRVPRGGPLIPAYRRPCSSDLQHSFLPRPLATLKPRGASRPSQGGSQGTHRVAQDSASLAPQDDSARRTYSYECHMDFIMHCCDPGL
ncbi:brain protein I3 isoform X2 [Heterocephalus glaber]|uniref:Brain protein I3 isoform X2 n=1 Tax=Heterocephalus glaber TaxID=10181 RepID=A0AAX6SPK2_HETGA|nr:brain protein I3 isoform X2 [Heterocephalus glaber]